MHVMCVGGVYAHACIDKQALDPESMTPTVSSLRQVTIPYSLGSGNRCLGCRKYRKWGECRKYRKWGEKRNATMQNFHQTQC